MALFDKFKKNTKHNIIGELLSKEYTQEYFDECKYIWKNFVPKNGQAHSLQGELLREIEKLRYEAQNNGNKNWDDDYLYFCDFISKSLSEQPIFSEDEKEEIRIIMTYIKDCGLYAKKYNDGKIKDSEVNLNKIAYTGEQLYDMICDKIGKLQRTHPEAIPYKVNNNISR